MGQTHGPSPQDLALLTSVIRDVVRVRRLPAADRQDFAQTVHLKFVCRNYDAFASFRGESSLRTYLSAVVSRALLDWRNARYGRWRPSVVAVRLGQDAIRLDTLINRDGYPEDAAVEIARATTGLPDRALRDLAARLPRRARRRSLGEDSLRAACATIAPDPIEVEEQRQRSRRIHHALARAYGRLPADEQRLLSLRYRHGLSIPEISGVLGRDQKPLYRRLDAIVGKLRKMLADHAPIAHDQVAGAHVDPDRSRSTKSRERRQS